MTEPGPPDAPILCLGEAIVDLVCEEEVAGLGEATSFKPHFGGALANVAVSVARHGGRAALGGGVGADVWGDWLRARLEREGIDLRWFSAVENLQTPVAFVAFGPGREPSFSVYGDGIRAGILAVQPRLEEAMGEAGALVFGSNTLVGQPERDLTLRARDLALERGIPVLFDPNVRPNRWDDMEEAWERCRDGVSGSFIARATLEEARGVAGLSAAAGAAECGDALCELGARVAVITMGAEGAIARGEAEGRAPAPTVEVVSPLGAGDAFFGALAARAAQGGWTPEAVVAGLSDAAAAGARACQSWEAVA